VGALIAGPLPAASADPVQVAMRINVAMDGLGHYSDAEGPGLDSGPDNGIVRTGDTIRYDVHVNVVSGTAVNETFTLTAPEGTAWVQVPGECGGSGSRIEGSRLICNVGDLTNATLRVPALLRVSHDLANGDQITTTGTVTADNAEPADVPSPDRPTTLVSARPAFNLVKGGGYETSRVSVAAPDGTEGVAFVYPVVVEAAPVDPAHPEYPPRLGVEPLRSPITFTDDLSTFLGGSPTSGARLWTWDPKGPACGQNNEGYVYNAPRSSGGDDNSVTDSGSFACEQAAPDRGAPGQLPGTGANLGLIGSAGLGLLLAAAFVLVLARRTARRQGQ
jgi:hypothetical protein